jgi:hypothetical protein
MTPLRWDVPAHMFGFMEQTRDQERQEVYERIPWEALERRTRDPSRLVIAVAGAVAVGALAFSFVRSQPEAPPTPSLPAAGTPGQSGVTASPPPPTTTIQPLVVAEADLYAVDEERLIGLAMAHAEWFAVEYYSIDGSSVSRETLAALLPEGVPAPEAPAGTQVYVDWVRALSVTEVAPLTYEVEVLVRSLVSGPDGAFVRQLPRRVVIEVSIDSEGEPRIVRPPTSAGEPISEAKPALMDVQIPDELRAEVESAHGPVIAGEPLADGRWRVIVMVTDPDGVARPRTMIVP